MTGYVVDASVAVKWLVAEDDSEESSRLLDTAAALIAPELLFAEVSNALWAMSRRVDIGKEEFAEAIDTLTDAPILTPASMRQLAPSAARLAIDLEHPVYDCFYLALAMLEQHTVITADRRFHAKVRDHPYLADRIVHVAEIARHSSR